MVVEWHGVARQPPREGRPRSSAGISQSPSARVLLVSLRPRRPPSHRGLRPAARWCSPLRQRRRAPAGARRRRWRRISGCACPRGLYPRDRRARGPTPEARARAWVPMSSESEPSSSAASRALRRRRPSVSRPALDDERRFAPLPADASRPTAHIARGEAWPLEWRDVATSTVTVVRVKQGSADEREPTQNPRSTRARAHQPTASAARPTRS